MDKLLVGLFVSSCLVLNGCSEIEIQWPQIEFEAPERGICAENPQHTYHYSLPAEIRPNDKLPLILVLDAHAGGKMAVEKFTKAASFMSCIIVGDNAIRNGNPDFLTLVREILKEAQNKFPVDLNQIILAGFSGGARMANQFATGHDMKGVLMLAAGPGKQQARCPVYAISGTRDFNFQENYYRPEIPALDRQNFTTDYFIGTHEWPPPSDIRDGILFLLKDRISVDLLDQRSRELIEGIPVQIEIGNYLDAWKQAEKAYKIAAGEEQRKECMEVAREIIRKTEFRNYIESLEKKLDNALNVRRIYFQNTTSATEDWWIKRIDLLNNRIEASESDLERDNLYRLKAFMGILLYSRANQWIRGEPENPQIPVLTKAFTYLEPDNPDAYYLNALHARNQNNIDEAMAQLELARKHGYADKQQIKMDFGKP